MMRTAEEVGGFKDFTDRANEAYRTYASIYLDFCDDNISHFVWRDHDVIPKLEIQDKLSGDMVKDEPLLVDTYLQHAMDIAKIEVDSKYFKSAEAIYAMYPPLRERSEIIKTWF